MQEIAETGPLLTVCRSFAGGAGARYLPAEALSGGVVGTSPIRGRRQGADPAWAKVGWTLILGGSIGGLKRRLLNTGGLDPLDEGRNCRFKQRCTLF